MDHRLLASGNSVPILPPPSTLLPHPPILLPSLGPKGASTISSPAPGSLLNSPGGSHSPSASGRCHWGRPQAAVPSSLLQDTGSRRGRVSAAHPPPRAGPCGLGRGTRGWARLRGVGGGCRAACTHAPAIAGTPGSTRALQPGRAH